MIDFLKRFTSAGGLLVSVLVVATTGHAFAWDEKPASEDKPAGVEKVVYNGVSCDQVRAKVAESGVTAAYAYARYIGLSSREIARVRKACSV